MKLLNVLLVVGVVASLVLGGLALFKPEPSSQPPFGAIPGSNLPDCVSQNGVETCAATVSMTATSSSVCVINNPFGTATSTLISFTASISSSSPTGIGLGVHLFDLATTTAAGGFGSSSPALIYAHSLASSATADTVSWRPVASSTLAGGLLLAINTGLASDGNSPYFIKGSEKLVYRIATGTPQTFSTYFVGNCRAVFQKVF